MSIPVRVAGSAVLASATGLVLQHGVPAKYLYILGASPVVLSIWSRLPQILLNLRQGHTGQLALATFAMSGLGNLARVYTTIKQTPEDTISVFSMVISSVLNITLVLQILVYWKSTVEATSKSRGKKSM